MKIEKIDFPADFEGYGLHEVKLERLSNLVLIAGQNGSGKTRFLNALSHGLRKKPTIASITEHRDQSENAKQQIKKLEAYIAQIDAKGTAASDVEKRNSRTYKKQLSSHQENIDRCELVTDWSAIECEKSYEEYVCLLYTSPSPRDKRQSRMPSSA